MQYQECLLSVTHLHLVNINTALSGRYNTSRLKIGLQSLCYNFEQFFVWIYSIPQTITVTTLASKLRTYSGQ